MSKKKKGFSLAELLISLLIISIVLSAAIPAITKKAGQQRELIWHWTEQNHVAFSAVGSNQSVILGLDAMPMNESPLANADNSSNTIMYDNSQYEMSFSVLEGELPDEDLETQRIIARDTVNTIDIGELKYTNTGDKLAILKRKVDSDSTNFANSHISFFNMNNGAGESIATYGGRITMDSGNIAMGIGTLQSLEPTFRKNEQTVNNIGENIAIGHFALLKDTTGSRNTAVGKKALSFNDIGSYNTALGFGSLYNLGKTESVLESSESITENTALGTEAQYNLQIGKQNTSIGSQSMKRFTSGDNNTVIGYYAMRGKYKISEADNTSANTPSGSKNTVVGSNAFIRFHKGDGNTILGESACNDLYAGSNNICIGSEIKSQIGAETHDSLFIGSTIDDETDTIVGSNNAPLISGHTIKNSGTTLNGSTYSHEQELMVNARKFKLQPYVGKYPIFEFDTLYGTDTEEDNYGYAAANGDVKTRFGVAKFNLRDTGSSEGTSIALKLEGTYPGQYAGGMVLIDTYDPYASKITDPETGNQYLSDDHYKDIYINNRLLIDFPKDGDKYKRVDIGLYDSSDTTAVTLEGNVKQKQNTQIPLSINGKLSVTYDEQTPDVLINKEDGFLVRSYDPEHNNNETSKKSFLRLKDSAGSGFRLIIKSDNANDFGQFSVGHYTDGEEDNSTTGFLYEDKNTPFIVKAGCGLDRKFYIDVNGYEVVERDDLCKSMIDIHKVTHISREKVSFDALARSDLGQADINNTGAANGDIVSVVNWLYTNKENIPSDLRKKNIISDNTAGLKEINQLEVKNFTYKDDEKKVAHVGVIAQQLQKIFPNAVIKGKDGYLSIRKEDIFFALVNSVKELYKQIQDTAAKIIGLDKRITELEKQNKLLKEQNAAFEKRFEALEKRQKALENNQKVLQ